MFENLTDRLEGVFRKLRGHGTLTEDNIQEAMREVRMALLEADVHFKVARDFVAGVTEKAIGREVSNQAWKDAVLRGYRLSKALSRRYCQ